MPESKSDPGLREEGAQVVDLVPWARTLHRARRTHRAFAPTRGSDPQTLAENDAAIAKAGVLEAYYAIKQKGLADAIPVLGVLTQAQIRTLFDLELWKSDALEVSDLLSWLEGFRIAGPSALVRAGRSMDPEALATLFRRRLHVAWTPKHDRSDDVPVPAWLVDPPSAIEPILQTPDGRFLVAARTSDERAELEGFEVPIEEEERKQVLALVRELYLDDEWERTAEVLRLAVDDLTSTLEEDALRFRNARVEDLGFPSRMDALDIYLPIAPGVLDTPGADYPILEEAHLPLMHAETLSRGLLDQILRRLPGPLASRIEGDLLALSNRVLVADAVDAADLAGLEAALERTRAYVELGLVHGVGLEARLEVAGRRLSEHHPQVLFRVGYTETLRAASRARNLLAHPGLGGLGLAAWRDAEQAVFEGLLETRPMFVDPTSAVGAESRRPFQSPEDLAAVTTFLEERRQLADALEEAQVFHHAVADEALPTEAAERDIDTRLATLGAHLLLGHGPGWAPLTAASLAELADCLGTSTEGDRFDSDQWTRAWADADVLGPAASAALEARVRGAVEALGVALFPLVGKERLDPRFIEGVLRIV